MLYNVSEAHISAAMRCVAPGTLPKSSTHYDSSLPSTHTLVCTHSCAATLTGAEHGTTVRGSGEECIVAWRTAVEFALHGQ